MSTHENILQSKKKIALSPSDIKKWKHEQCSGYTRPARERCGGYIIWSATDKSTSYFCKTCAYLFPENRDTRVSITDKNTNIMLETSFERGEYILCGGDSKNECAVMIKVDNPLNVDKPCNFMCLPCHEKYWLSVLRKKRDMFFV